MEIAITNSSTLVSDADVAIMTQACQIQNTLHCSPAWNQTPAIITFYADKSKVPGHSWLITVIDNEVDVPDALGFHSIDPTDDRVVGFIMCEPVLSNGGVALYDANNPQNVSVSSVLSHEICEAFLDRFCNFWVDGTPIRQGSEYALEVSDPVEDVSYVIEVGAQKVLVSDFVFPSFFNMASKLPENAPLDYCNKLTEPFTMTPGGYQVVRVRPGAEVQVFGRSMPQWKRDIKSKSTFRRFNRRDQKIGLFAALWKWLK